ncbi:2575_t:CDS:2 [Funneliformis mosseae]|uniref:2575_t:CDS:1 n=1 Tax=Funneliformis mosseae TaxID=27381 RepID=A0A9N8ZPP5_FUNMO|nr:2575_t:CDS:2 [Funneliformis mosseae]
MIQIVKVPIIDGKVDEEVYNNQLDGYFTKEEFTSRLKSFNLVYKTYQEKYLKHIILPLLLPIFCIITIFPVVIIKQIHRGYVTPKLLSKNYIGLIGGILPLIFVGCILWYCIVCINYKRKMQREIHLLVTKNNSHDYSRHVHWKIIKERNGKPTFSVSNYTEFLTVNIVKDLRCDYNLSYRSTSSVNVNRSLNNLSFATLMDEDLSFSPPPPVYSSSSHNCMPDSSSLHSLSPENFHSRLEISANNENDRVIEVIDRGSNPSFFLNLPPPTYQEALKDLDGTSVSFVERKQGNDGVDTGMGRRGSYIRGWL